jgi:hypothetical protein
VITLISALPVPAQTCSIAQLDQPLPPHPHLQQFTGRAAQQTRLNTNLHSSKLACSTAAAAHAILAGTMKLPAHAQARSDNPVNHTSGVLIAACMGVRLPDMVARLPLHLPA